MLTKNKSNIWELKYLNKINRNQWIINESDKGIISEFKNRSIEKLPNGSTENKKKKNLDTGRNA